VGYLRQGRCHAAGFKLASGLKYLPLMAMPKGPLPPHLPQTSAVHCIASDEIALCLTWLQLLAGGSTANRWLRFTVHRLCIISAYYRLLMTWPRIDYFRWIWLSNNHAVAALPSLYLLIDSNSKLS